MNKTKVIFYFILSLIAIYYCFAFLMKSVYVNLSDLIFSVLVMILLLSIPFIISLLLEILAKKFEKKKVLYIFLKLIDYFMICISFLYYVFLIGFYFFSHIVLLIPVEKTNIDMDKYSIYLKNEKNIEHFPENLPKNIKDYTFEVETYLQGDKIYFLKFISDETFIQRELLENKKNIVKEVDYKSFCNKNSEICTHFLSKKEDNCRIYLIKDAKNTKKGIVTSLKTNKIGYFDFSSIY